MSLVIRQNQVHGTRKWTYLKALELDAFRREIEILRDNDVYKLPSIKAGMHRA